MAVAAIASIPLGRASDRWGRRPLLLAGIGATGVTSLLLPMAQGEIALAVIYGLAGLGIAAFTPSTLSLVADTARAGRTGNAYAWYSTAHYGAIAVGPFLGGLAAQWWGYRAAFVASAAATAIALAVGLAVPGRRVARPSQEAGAGLRAIGANPAVWAGWIASVGGLLIQGVVFTFLPLLASGRGVTPGAIGLVFLVLGIANTAARVPAGWLIDRTGGRVRSAVGGLLVGSLATAFFPHAEDPWRLLALAAVFGGASGLAFVGVSTALAAAATPATRGVVMGGYSTSLYLGLAVGSFALGPVITHHGYSAGFVTGGVLGGLGTIVAALLWRDRSRPTLTPGEAAPRRGSGVPRCR